MEFNVGTWDRALRIVLGLFLLALVFVGPRSPLGMLGIIPLASGIAGHCPVYRLFGWSTCRLRGKHAGSGAA